MFKNNAALSAREHGDLRILETNNYAYANGELLAPIVLSEIAEVAREYPIVFPDNKNRLPSALLGLEANQNAYVSEDGRWLATYVPAHIRRYPFALAEMPSQKGQKENDVRFSIVVDLDAPHLKSPHGHSVFTPGGKLSPHVQGRVKLLERVQKSLAVTRRLVEVLESSGLLVERIIRIQRKGQEPHQFSGLRIVDEKKLNGLPDGDFSELRNRGVLPLIYAHLLSWANLRQGPLAGKYPDLATKPETSDPAFLFESGLIDLSQV